MEEETLSRNENADGYRLPTSLEHEYAARGGADGDATVYPGSDNIDKVAWYNANSNNETHRVGLKAPNELGLFDMGGNVADWVDDGRSFDEPVTYRGGGYTSGATNIEVGSTTNEVENVRLVLSYTGFRLARPSPVL
ncbi:formylglycine-generating enzyme family protein [Halanaerobium hydrogeniformans]|uniref:formylglycine-generating enzyme family protein n=1 Tax=Halanaerobium hydrogeniformans TaxID=656519 RepID=UPI0030834B69